MGEFSICIGLLTLYTQYVNIKKKKTKSEKVSCFVIIHTHKLESEVRLQGRAGACQYK